RRRQRAAQAGLENARSQGGRVEGRIFPGSPEIAQHELRGRRARVVDQDDRARRGGARREKGEWDVVAPDPYAPDAGRLLHHRSRGRRSDDYERSRVGREEAAVEVPDVPEGDVAHRRNGPLDGPPEGSAAEELGLEARA